MARPTVADLARHARIPADQVEDQQADLQAYVTAAVSLVEARCGPMVDSEPVRVRMNHTGTLVIPFVGLTAATVTGPDDEPITLDERQTDYASGVLTVRSRRLGYYQVTVTRDERATNALWLATLIVAAHLWDVRRGARPGDGSFDDVYAPGVGYAVPRRAAELMAPWRTPVLG